MYENLKAELKRHSLSYKDIAIVTMTRPATIATRLAGMSDWKLQEIWKIADVLRCPIDYLIGRNVPKDG